MNTALKLRTTGSTPADVLAAHPPVGGAIELVRGKLALKARSEADALGADLKLILSDWCEERGITSISWASDRDPVAPTFAIEFLTERLAQRLSELRFTKFLETFCEQMIELGEAELRSQ